MFGSSRERPFTPSAVARRALTDWRRAGLAPIGLHEARHTFASLAIAAGVNPKALSVYMGHASVTITLDRYGHLFPGNEDEAAGLLDAYLEAAVRQSRHRIGRIRAVSAGRAAARSRLFQKRPRMQALPAPTPRSTRCPRQESNLRHQV